jgi:hypothetical protein
MLLGLALVRHVRAGDSVEAVLLKLGIKASWYSSVDRDFLAELNVRSE